MLQTICKGQDKNSAWHAEIKWDNDFLNYRLAGTDRYYTNGLFINLLIPVKRPGSLLQKILFNDTAAARTLRETGIYQKMFTPNNIAVPYISHGDYPYIGLLAGHYSTIINSTTKSFRLRSTVTLGTMGVGSLAEEGQKFIHHLIHYQLPEGWQNEVNKPLVYNYELILEKGLFANSNWLQCIPYIGLRAGTINTSASVGTTVQIGSRENYFSFFRSYSFQDQPAKRFRVYFTWQPRFTWVYRNGLLEPALQKTIALYKQAYQIDNAYPVIQRSLFDQSAGIYFCFRKTRIGFVQTFYARELSTTTPHQVGSLDVAFAL